MPEPSEPKNPYQSPQSPPPPSPFFPPPQAPPDSTGGLIPYNNSYALIGYYTAIASLIPCLGLITGMVAVVLGILGLLAYNENSNIGGAVHSWIAIILGGLTFLGNVGIVALPVIAAASA